MNADFFTNVTKFHFLEERNKSFFNVEAVLLCMKPKYFNFDVIVYFRWFIHFYIVGSLINSFMFLLILFSYTTLSALPFVIKVAVDLLCIGSKQHVVNTGETFSCYKFYIVFEVLTLDLSF